MRSDSDVIRGIGEIYAFRAEQTITLKHYWNFARKRVVVFYRTDLYPQLLKYKSFRFKEQKLFTKTY